jgi:hypothetical protein
MIEAVIKPDIVVRVNRLCDDYGMMATYSTRHLYLGREEYDELRARLDVSPHHPALPPLGHYHQGSLQFLGMAVFVLKDIQSHLALA